MTNFSPFLAWLTEILDLLLNVVHNRINQTKVHASAYISLCKKKLHLIISILTVHLDFQAKIKAFRCFWAKLLHREVLSHRNIPKQKHSYKSKRRLPLNYVNAEKSCFVLWQLIRGNYKMPQTFRLKNLNFSMCKENV